MAGQADSMKSILFALTANAAIGLAKLGGALVTGSSAMLAEAIHSFADCGNQALLILGIKRSARAPTPAHPLGYGKTIYVWSFIVAIILFSVGGLFSMYEGAHKLSSPEPLTWPWLAVGILVFGIAAEGVALRAVMGEIDKVRGDRSYWRWFRESRQSELIVVFGEDIAAIGGLILAVIALLAAIATGNPMFDALGSIAIGVVLVLVAIGVGIEVKALLIGQSADPSIERSIRQFIEQRPEVAQVYRVITLQLGARIMVAVKSRMRETQAVAALIDDINRCESAVREAFPQIQWLFFEPDRQD